MYIILSKKNNDCASTKSRNPVRSGVAEIPHIPHWKNLSTLCIQFSQYWIF
jgi:hypothetical protein